MTNRRQIFGLLFLSSLGTCVFMASMPAYLLSIGFSAIGTAALIGMTALPNAFFGLHLGRLVDRSQKRALFFRLSVFLAGVECLILFCGSFYEGGAKVYLIGALLLPFAFAFSPLMTLIYQYIIPSLHEDEGKVFAIWEGLTALAAILSAVVAYLFLSVWPASSLIIFDAATFVIAGFLVSHWWDVPAVQAEADKAGQSWKTTLRLVMGDARLWMTALAMFVVALVMSSIEVNTTLISIEALKFADNISVSAAAALGGVAVISAWLCERMSKTITNNLASSQILTLAFYGMVAGLMAFAFYFDSAVLVLASIFIAAFIEPIFGVVNVRLIRQGTPPGMYGEVNGLIRMPRAILTTSGVILVGFAQTANKLWLFAAIGFVMLFIVTTIAVLRKSGS
jgi:MFS family permease